jgi:hypothetical protein
MGAVTALFYVASTSQNLIKGMILDSSFISLRRMVLEYVSETTKLPEILLYPLIPLINHMLREKIGLEFDDFEIKEQLNYLECNAKQNIPHVRFLASRNDVVVKCSHSEELMKLYPGKNKNIQYIKQTHEEDRPRKVIKDCVEFLAKTLAEVRKAEGTDKFYRKKGYLGNSRGVSAERTTYQQPYYSYGTNFNGSFTLLRNNVYLTNYYNSLH